MAADQLNVELNLDAKEFSDGIKSAISLIKKLDAAIEVTDDTIKKNRSVIRSWAKAVRGSLTEFYSLTQLISPLTNSVTSVTNSFIRANAEWEKTVAIMSGLTSGAETVEEATRTLNTEIAYLEDLATRTPFTIQNLQTAMVKLKAGGVQDLQYGMEALVDSVAKFGGTSQELDRASIAIQQMAGKGVVSMEELRQQLGEAVPNAMALMARGLNMSMGELAAVIETGTLEANSAIKAMFYQMEIENGGSAERMMVTWDGIMSQIRTRLNKIMREMGDTGLFDEMKNQLQGFLDVLNRPETMTFFTDLARSMTELIRDIIDLAKYIDDLNVTMDILRNLLITFALVKFTQGISGMSKAFYKLVGGVDDSIKAFKGLGSPMAKMRQDLAKQKQLTQASMEMWGFYNGAMIKAGDTAKRKKIIMKGLTDTIRGLGSALAVMGRRFMSLLGPIGAVVSIALELASAFNLFGNELDNVREKAREMSTTLTSDEYAKVSDGIKDTREELARLIRIQEKYKDGASKTTSSYGQSNPDAGRFHRLQNQIDTLTKSLNEDLLLQSEQATRMATNAAESYVSEFNRRFQAGSQEIRLSYTKQMNEIERLRQNQDNMDANALNKLIEQRKSAADRANFEEIRALQDKIAEEEFLRAKANIEMLNIDDGARQKQIEAVRKQRDLVIAENLQTFNQSMSMMTQVTEAGVKQLDKAKDEWDVTYRQLYVEQATLMAKINGENVIFAKAQAKATLAKQSDIVYTQAQAKALAEGNIELAKKLAKQREVAAEEKRAQKNSVSEVDKLLTTWSDVTSQMDSMWAGAFKNMSGSLADFVMTGKLDFQSLTNSIIKNLIQISIQSAMSDMFNGAGSFLGGLFGGGGAAAGAGAGATVSTFAQGGVAKARHPQVAVFGEGDMNEAFVPLPDGRSIPVSMNGSATPNVSVNVINQTGQNATAEQQDMKFDGEQWVLDVVMKAMDRPGQFRSSMKGTNRQ